ncbi:MAG: winged helix-turn-helix domain-containing protein [Pseudomonadota bacterium]|nr:winged helix-turn-helix domain-containing protein [Pseudomonadota bacterium]
MNSPEPRFARIAALLADPTRARMLALLLPGESRTAGELARAAGITPQAATSQLAQLAQAGLLSVRAQGRHKYLALADADVAHALEALALVAERDAVATRWHRPAYAPLKHARRCYGHLAGELGVAQLHMLLARGLLAEGDAGFALTDAGTQWLAQLGVPAPAPPQPRAGGWLTAAWTGPSGKTTWPARWPRRCLSTACSAAGCAPTPAAARCTSRPRARRIGCRCCGCSPADVGAAR